MRKHILIIILAVSIACLMIIPQVYGDEKTEHNCTKCHQITNSEAQNILREGIPDAKVLEAGPGPVKGLWEVAFDSKGQKGIVYISFSKELVVSGAVFNLKTKTNLTGDRLYSLNRVDISQIPLGDALVMGDKNAKYKVVVFDDPD
ncbi:MAG: disulfide isomerase DsbC N-terminal domain-containing protein [Thermodesulfovibrionales bacterium]